MKPPPGDMTCRELVELVTAYLEGGLAPAERGRFEAHRDGCPGCRDHVSQVRLAVSSLRSLRQTPDIGLPAEQRRMLDLFRARGLHRAAPRDRDIPLGIGSALAAQGDHIAYFWESEREFDATAGYLAAGASAGEACVLIGHDAAHERLLANLERSGLPVRALMEERQIQVASTRSSVEGLLLEIDGRIRDAVDRGMPMVRVLGNLLWGRGAPGWPSDRDLLMVEAHVTGAVARLPSIVVCSYDANRLPAPILQKGGVECHPLICRRDGLRHNEQHVPLDRFLVDLSAG